MTELDFGSEIESENEAGSHLEIRPRPHSQTEYQQRVKQAQCCFHSTKQPRRHVAAELADTLDQTAHTEE